MRLSNHNDRKPFFGSVCESRQTGPPQVVNYLTIGGHVNAKR